MTDRKHPGKDVTINPMKAILHTTAGDITVELFPNHAPNTVHNFVTLAKGEREWVDPEDRPEDLPSPSTRRSPSSTASSPAS